MRYLIPIIALALVSPSVSAQNAVPPGVIAWQATFEEAKAQPDGWKIEGGAAVKSGEAFKGDKALVLSKTEATLRDAVSATSPEFPVKPGAVEVKFAARTDLTSMDNSYNGSLVIDFLDAAGKSAGTSEISTLFRQNNWKPGTRQIEVPEGALSARLVARINKESPGEYALDELMVTGIPATKKPEQIERMMFTTAQVGNLLFPSDSREIEIEVWARQALPQDQQKVSLSVRDYWGAEQAMPLTVKLEPKGLKDQTFIYKGKVDLAAVPMEIGRYYALHGEIERGGAEPFRNYSSLAILPEAPANAYKPMEIPFTSRNWDNRVPAYVDLTHRLGIRICGIWGRMEADPEKTQAPLIERVAELDMGFLTGSPVQSIIRRDAGWEKNYSEEKLRQGVRNFFAKFGSYRPAVVNLGNEPHTKGEDVKIDIAAYKAVYTEIKKIDPNIFVVGTSVNLQEDHFKYGFGEWLDAYDFHVYEDAASVRKTVEVGYPAMFRKYGFAKPVWSTELGLNSQGMARQFVAAEVYRKLVNFFAGGGANASWFGMVYPDPKGTSADSFGSAHNTFDCRYSKYAPKLDAVAYFNAINTIAIKKFVEDRVYRDNTHAFLFRDRNDQALQVWYRNKGREDLFIPLPGVGKVRITRIDGSLRDLDADGKGITLTITEDPILLTYAGGEKTLPEKTQTPAITLGRASGSVVRGEQSRLDVVLNSAESPQLDIQVPPFWKTENETAKDADGRTVVRYTLQAPEDSAVREADMTVSVKSGDKIIGQIYHRPIVTGALEINLLPVPASPGQPVTIKLVIQNNSPMKQQANWDVVLTGEQTLADGVFSAPKPASAYFADTASGVVEIEAKQSREIMLPLVKANLSAVYRVRAVVRDASGRIAVQERPVAAFYGVPKTKSAITLDGKIDEAAWQDAPVRKLDAKDQFFAFKSNTDQPADWTGADDLSGEIRYLWSDEYLYVSVKVRDDAAAVPLLEGGQLWKQDGLQFLVDPMRTSDQKVGKYDYVLGVGTKGPQVWCSLSADGDIRPGEISEIKFATATGRKGTNDLSYEIAIPWANLAPFDPKSESNLGLTAILNEGDNESRNAFMTWFGNAHNKDIDTVGDLVLLP